MKKKQIPGTLVFLALYVHPRSLAMWFALFEEQDGEFTPIGKGPFEDLSSTDVLNHMSLDEIMTLYQGMEVNTQFTLEEKRLLFL